MDFFLAAYDPAHDTGHGDYWVWSHPELPTALRNNFYYEVAAKNLPDKPNELPNSDCLGGWATVDNTWGCWYRFFDGGRDLRGRPGRFVLLCAFCRRRDNANKNAFAVLDSEPFQRLATNAISSRPLLMPDNLELSQELPVIEQQINQGPAGDETVDGKFAGVNAPEKMASAYANLPPSSRFHCKIERRDGQLSIKVLMQTMSVKRSMPEAFSTGRESRDLPSGGTRLKSKNLERRPTTVERVNETRRLYGLPDTCVWLLVSIPLAFVFGGMAGFFIGRLHTGHQPTKSSSLAPPMPGGTTTRASAP